MMAIVMPMPGFGGVIFNGSVNGSEGRVRQTSQNKRASFTTCQGPQANCGEKESKPKNMGKVNQVSNKWQSSGWTKERNAACGLVHPGADCECFNNHTECAGIRR